jgi:hypothetical protein
MRTLISLLLLLSLTTACASGPSKSELDAEVERLCAIDGGVRVYETVTLPADKFDKNGNVHIPLKKNAKPSDEYFYEWEARTLKAGNPDDGGAAVTWRDHFKFYRAKDSKLLGEDISYARRGGDIPGPWHPSSFRCPSVTQSSDIEKLIFLKGNEK